MGIVAQTTQSLDNLRLIVEVCLQKSKELRVFNTICDATAVRQSEARNIARQVDLMLVLGGFNSANTNRLAQTLSRNTAPHPPCRDGRTDRPRMVSGGRNGGDYRRCFDAALDHRRSHGKGRGIGEIKICLFKIFMLSSLPMAQAMLSENDRKIVRG